MSELLPCPFCGSEAEILTGKSLHGERLYGIMCNCCTARTDLFDTEDSAINSWNSRAERTCNVEGVSADYGWLDERDPIYTFTLSCGHVHDSLVNDPPRYCQICGAKVVD